MWSHRDSTVYTHTSLNNSTSMPRQTYQNMCTPKHVTASRKIYKLEVSMTNMTVWAHKNQCCAGNWSVHLNWVETVAWVKHTQISVNLQIWEIQQTKQYFCVHRSYRCHSVWYQVAWQWHQFILYLTWSQETVYLRVQIQCHVLVQTHNQHGTVTANLKLYRKFLNLASHTPININYTFEVNRVQTALF